MFKGKVIGRFAGCLCKVYRRADNKWVGRLMTERMDAWVDVDEKMGG